MNLAVKLLATAAGAAVLAASPIVASANKAESGAEMVQPPPDAPPVGDVQPSPDPSAPTAPPKDPTQPPMDPGQSPSDPSQSPSDPSQPPPGAVVPSDPNAPAGTVPPPDPNSPSAAPVMPPQGPSAAAVPPPEAAAEMAVAAVGPAPETYPPCSATVTDRCMQTGRSSRRTRR
jgi:hypothetical protein